MIIWTIGLEGCGHHGLEAVIKQLLNIDELAYYKNKRRLHKILNTYSKSKDGDTFKKQLGNFLSNRNLKSTYYIDKSFPSGFKQREVINQWPISKIYNELSEFTPIKLIHLKRNIFDTINSHPHWDGGILGHTQKIAQINHFILNELTILKKQETEVIDINYEDINQSSNILASILSVDQNLVQDAIDRKFKLSKKSYKNLLDNHTIEQMDRDIQRLNRKYDSI
jgi:hypothetical protein